VPKDHRAASERLRTTIRPSPRVVRLRWLLCGRSRDHHALEVLTTFLARIAFRSPDPRRST